MLPAMKTLLIAVMLAFTAQIHAQGFAPTSLSNQIYTVVVSSGTGLFATTGVASKVFLANGQAVVLDSSGDIQVDQRASYSYTKTGPNSGSIVQELANTTLSTQALLTFTSPVSGTYIATVLTGGTGTQTATFSLSPSTQPPLVNLSTRTNVAAGGQSIAGFVVNGNSTSRVIIRGVGPTLANFGVPGTLSAPHLQIFRSNVATPLAVADAWGSSPSGASTLRSAFASIGAFALGEDSKDTALLLNLEPGAYTAVVTGGSAADAGEVLIEVYLFP
jgi:hypothetical protein